jgi:hypothetical protein
MTAKNRPYLKKGCHRKCVTGNHFGFVCFVIIFDTSVPGDGAVARNLSNISALKCNCKHAN